MLLFQNPPDAPQNHATPEPDVDPDDPDWPPPDFVVEEQEGQEENSADVGIDPLGNDDEDSFEQELVDIAENSNNAKREGSESVECVDIDTDSDEQSFEDLFGVAEPNPSSGDGTKRKESPWQWNQPIQLGSGVEPSEATSSVRLGTGVVAPNSVRLGARVELFGTPKSVRLGARVEPLGTPKSVQLVTSLEPLGSQRSVQLGARVELSGAPKTPVMSLGMKLLSEERKRKADEISMLRKTAARPKPPIPLINTSAGETDKTGLSLGQILMNKEKALRGANHVPLMPAATKSLDPYSLKRRKEVPEVLGGHNFSRTVKLGGAIPSHLLVRSSKDHPAPEVEPSLGTPSLGEGPVIVSTTSHQYDMSHEDRYSPQQGPSRVSRIPGEMDDDPWGIDGDSSHGSSDTPPVATGRKSKLIKMHTVVNLERTPRVRTGSGGGPASRSSSSAPRKPREPLNQQGGSQETSAQSSPVPTQRIALSGLLLSRAAKKGKILQGKTLFFYS